LKLRGAVIGNERGGVGGGISQTIGIVLIEMPNGYIIYLHAMIITKLLSGESQKSEMMPSEKSGLSRCMI
jgi:hypothetical protein